MPGAAERAVRRAAPAQEFTVTLADGATVIVASHGEGRRVVVSHGNGLAVEAYEPFWSLLAERYEVVTFSQRHHGRNSPYQGPLKNIPQFVDDFDVVLAAIEQRLGSARSYGAFHSLSALVALMHATTRPSPWSGLVAFEPPIPPPAETDLSRRVLTANRALANGAARRRETFGDIEELAASFAKRDAFRRVPAAARRRLSEATLRPRDEGGYELSCAREFEAETFRLRHAEHAWAAISRLSIPICLVGSDPAQEDPCLAQLAATIAAEGGFAFRSIPNTTHFLQLEDPVACANAVHEFISSLEAKRG